MNHSAFLLPAILALATSAGQQAAAQSTSTEGIEFFESKVRPLLLTHCSKCHTAKKAAESGELVLDSPAGIQRGGSRGALFAPAKPSESLILKAVSYADAELQMPPDGKLPAAEIAVLTKWLDLGAPLPAAENSAASIQQRIDIESGRKFWSFQPLSDFVPPVVSRANWPRAAIDAFILARLESEGLAPSSTADRRTLIRRLALDLVGLPPAAEDVEAFVADARPDAYERLVDRLLSSPHYGERWGRYWLDMARYTDENPSWLSSAKLAYRYRDWVVSALNSDLPYDRFVRLQLAADVMPETSPGDLTALGFLGLSPTYWKELRLAPQLIEVIVADEWDEKIDAVSRTFLGLTVACARCHDHKFDPITTRDYYALAGVFANTQQVDRPLLDPEPAEAVRQARRQIDALEADLAKIKDKEPDKAAELKAQIERLKTETPGYDAQWAHAVEEARVEVLPDGPDKTKVVYHRGEASDLQIFKRGNPSNRGEIVPRRFVEVLSPAPMRPFEHGSGRRELADSLFTEAQALSARVIVNRVWAHHFGVGLVRTTSDFGRQGEPPSHPELLDDLAERFVARGWSLKRLHREIVLSATYRQVSHVKSRKSNVEGQHASDIRPSTLDLRHASSVDPANRLLWRMNRRRLDVEAWRDALLSASGELDLAIGGPPDDLARPENRRRTLYGRIGREDQDNLLLLYDFPTPTGHSPSREQTTTPLQQLFVLNSPLFEARAKALAERIGPPAAASDTDQQVTSLYRELLARPPSDRELTLAREFLAAGKWDEYVHAVLGSNEVMFVD
ncbi:MAG: PSD1 and planctomycete cytochrome C domain-containing protein [Planctomycetaceae bacterium]|nr:PSD1 and planctomycete cytochrome C domain-containing protein [Planctomycetaceae bacterium]